MLLNTFLSFSTLIISSLAATSANPDSSTGTILYVNSPACDSYKCVVDWTQGTTVYVNWLNPPSGSVSIALASNVGGATYPIVASTPATNTAGNCDAGSGFGVPVSGSQCGGVEFVVPGGWVAAANYTIVVTSLSTPSIVGYTDAVTIVKGSNAPAGIVPTLINAAAPASSSAAAVVVASSSNNSPSATVVLAGSTSAAAIVVSSTPAVASSVSSTATAMITSLKNTSTAASPTATGNATLSNSTTSASSTAVKSGASRQGVVVIEKGILLGGLFAMGLVLLL